MAVYTEVSDEALEAFLAEYEIGGLLSCKGIAEGVENSNFMLHTDGGSFILTLYEKRVHAEDLPFFLGLMNHLAAKGLKCPVPIKRKDGEFLGALAGRPAAIISFLEGMSVHRPQAKHCRELGAAMARFHLAGQDFPLTRANSLSVDQWRPLYLSCEGRADEVQKGLARDIEAELDALEKIWPQNLPRGVIHADAFPDNVFFIHDELSGLIDFYFACTDAFAYDLAICLNAWCFEKDGAFNATKARALFQAYQQVRPLTDAELKALPLLARGSALRFLLTRLYDWLNQPPGALVKPKDPRDYWKRLRFHRDVKSAAAYGIDE
ncbi:homoserine kinase [Tepidicaulis marinus]|uniref:Homoserine kinase n=1 Tax=Tepidicaulis marinus TaxID=1333998 RepID=A0A081BAG1_9HYPH|nr:homoserine kinase [Tepidicaulis marinus]GAK45029.1 homoserine kinase [Tepidicaulis marinus]